jgi:hypothetical protein
MPLGAARFGLGGVDLGKLELIQTQTVSSASRVNFVDFTSIKESTYNVHFLTVNNYANDTDNSILSVRFYESGTIETASVYQAAYQEYYNNGTFSEFKSTGIDHIRIIENTGNATNETGHCYVYLYNLGDSSKYSFTTAQTSGIWTNGSYIGAFGGGVLPQTSTVDGIRVDTFNVSGAFSGTFSLYGIKE